MTDAELESQLRAVGETIGADADLVDGVRARISQAGTPTRRWRPGAVAASFLFVAATLTLLLVAPARDAVAGWLGIGSTTITLVEELPDTPTTSAPQRPATPHDMVRAAASEALGLEILLPHADAVGDMAGWEILDLDGERELVVAWDTVALTARPSDGDFRLRKIVTSEEIVSSEVTTDGDPALWVGAPHIRVTEEGPATVDDALLWVRGGIEYRLIGTGDVDDAIAIAATLE